jgi:hypothetical protein
MKSSAKKMMAAGAASLMILVSAMPGLAGAIPGRQRAASSANAGAADVYTIVFRGGEAARVIVSGDGDTDLDLYIYDQFGNLITKDDDSSDDCVVGWTPRWTGKFTIRIVNQGRVHNHYVMATN